MVRTLRISTAPQCLRKVCLECFGKIQQREFMENGIYIYGIIKTSSPKEFGKIGIDDKAASNVLTIEHKNIETVDSNSPLTCYNTRSNKKDDKNFATHPY